MWGSGSPPCPWALLRPHVSTQEPLSWDQGGSAGPRRLLCTTSHACIVSACVHRVCMPVARVHASYLYRVHHACMHACMHRFPACTMHFASMCAAFCAPPGRHASGLHACNVPACLQRACMHAGFFFDVQAVLGLSMSHNLPGSTLCSGTIWRTVTVDDRRET